MNRHSIQILIADVAPGSSKQSNRFEGRFNWETQHMIL